MVALLLAVAGRYGFHRDELYFIAAGRRLDWGYVDQPPLTPLLARLGDLIPGEVTPLAIRVVPALCAGAVVVMAALIARRLGAGRRAVLLAAVFTAGSAFLLAVGHLLSTTTVDVVIWVAVILLVMDLLDGGDPRLWIGVGVLMGLGLQNKYTIVALAAALLVAIVATPSRVVLRSRWVLLGAGLAFLMALPNLLWQAANDWPQLEIAGSLAGEDGPGDYLLLQMAILSVFLVVPAAAGLRRLFGSATWRPVAWAFLLVLVGLLVAGGKGYYVAPLYVPLLAAGAMWLEERSQTVRRSVLGVTVVGMSFGLFAALPLVPPSSVSVFNEINKELGETYGWRQYVAQVAEVQALLAVNERSVAAILTSNYGEAGAIEVLGGGLLPQPSSGHNNYWLWGPPPDSAGSIIGVGPVAGSLRLVCPGLEQVGVVGNEAGVENEELGRPLWLCNDPAAPLSSIWDRVGQFG